MPPKPRGRGSSRARGGARGARGGSAARQSNSELTATPIATATPLATAPAPSDSGATEAGEPNRDDGDISMTDAPAAETSSDSQALNADTPAQFGAEAATRAPAQRLGSLQGAVPPSGSPSPSVRGRGGTPRGIRGTRGKIMPTFTGRRSKEERDALAKEAAARDKERNKEYDAATAASLTKKSKDDRREADRATRQRGGYSNVASGPFSLGSSTADKNSGRNRGASGYPSASGSGSRATRVKDEEIEHADPGQSTHRSGGGRSSFKEENKGYVSSEEEDDADVPRQDIAHIEISSDDDDAKPDATPKQRSARSVLPVRIGRKEHQLRTFAINTDSSTDPSTNSLDQAAIKGQSSTSGPSEQNARKGKGKATGIQPKREESDFKGVWVEEDEGAEGETVLGVADDAGLSRPTSLPNGKEESIPANGEGDTGGEKPKTPRKRGAKKARKGKNKMKEEKLPAEPDWVQTEQQRAEWVRIQMKQKHMLAELGPEATLSVDGAGDVAMTGTNEAKKPTTVRDNNAYIFQIPPKMPELHLPANYKESSDHASGSGPAKIKHEPGDSTDPNVEPTTRSPMPSGRAGKLRVHASGKTTLEWGNTTFQVNAANNVSFRQEAASVKFTPEGTRMIVGDAGEVASYGRIKGRFIVTPDWNALFAK